MGRVPPYLDLWWETKSSFDAFKGRLVLSQPHLVHATPVFVSLPCPGAQTLGIQIDQRVKATQFVTELGSNSQLHAIKLDEHAVAQLLIKPIEGYH